MTTRTPRIAVVTGAVSGIGAAIAHRLLQGGAQVVGLDRDEPGLAAAAQRHGDGFLPVGVDVGDAASVERAARELSRHVGAVDALVNSAGIGGYTGDVVETSLDQWQRVLAVNLTGAFLVSRAVLPAMRDRAGASVVHVASQYALVGGAGFPAYCAAKAGLVGLTRAMAVDHAPDGIRVNCVCPGPTDTPMLRASAADATGGRREDQRVAHRSLLTAPGEPARVADVVAFLLGPGAVTMTGAIVPVDGGWSAA
jgi:NAD(P)-dependent dehydrogenase (short-subunit alcohol dehydrogenase family)